MILKNPTIPISIILLFTGCATMKQTNVHEGPIQNKPQVSKTIQVQKSNLPRSLKRKVAIARFSNETRYGQSFFVDNDNNRIGKQAMDILSTKLYETGKFIMLERADLSMIEKELDMEGTPSINNSADYIILGSITEFGRKETSDVGIFSRVKKQEAFAKVHIRIVDVSTGQIIYSEEGKGTAYSEAGAIFGVGSKSAYDGQLNDKAIEAALSNLASNIIENMLDKPWRGYILDFEDGNFITSGGKSQNIKIGDTFDVMKKGKQVKNPQTNTMISLPSKKIASIEIINIFGSTPDTEVSLASLTSGNLDSYTKRNDFSNLFIQIKKEK